VLIMETTRGNRQLPPGFSREAEIERLSNASCACSSAAALC
jgi:hypothetical protein